MCVIEGAEGQHADAEHNIRDDLRGQSLPAALARQHHGHNDGGRRGERQQEQQDDLRRRFIAAPADKFRETFHMLYVACGDQDNFYEKTRENAQQIMNQGVGLTTFFDTGRHDWTFWRHCCVNFLQRIFRT